MRRRTYRQIRSASEASLHHYVYVVELDPVAARIRSVLKANPKRDPAKLCVYVGMSGLKPEERFANHKAGHKASSLVRRYGIRLVPGLYEYLNPMPFEAAVQMEQDLAEDLRRQGYTVTGGTLVPRELCRSRAHLRITTKEERMPLTLALSPRRGNRCGRSRSGGVALLQSAADAKPFDSPERVDWNEGRRPANPLLGERAG